MASLYMITFRCPHELFERLERFALHRNIDRTSVLKLALHYYMNRIPPSPVTAGNPTVSLPLGR